MHLTFAPNNILQIDEAKIIFRNFAGVGSKFNREGDRNFSVLIEDEDVANALADRDYNVKIKPPREEGDTPFMHLPVKVKFNERGPRVFLKTGERVNELDEESIAVIDDIDIASVDMDLRTYEWEVNGKTGRTVYLQSMHVVQEVDRFADRYNL